MPKGQEPSVFVSSTCYDLSQVRLDLVNFIQGFGFHPVVSESSLFPVDPHSSTFQNCVDAVKDRADIFVLVVGARYGSLTPDGKSITNHEYLQARAKGIPIYVFVNKSIKAIMSVWRENPTGSYDKVVDNPKLFEFVEKLQSKDGHWVYGFENLSDITQVLRSQWAILFMNSLISAERMRNASIPVSLKTLDIIPLRIYIERPYCWEYLLFGETLDSFIRRQSSLKKDIEFGIRIGPIVRIDDPLKVLSWLHVKLAKISNLVHSIGQITNEALQRAIGLPGIEGDAELLAYCALRLGEVYKQLLIWRRDILSVVVHIEFTKVVQLLSEFAIQPLSKIEEFPMRIRSTVNTAEEMKSRKEIYECEINLDIGIGDTGEIIKELNKLTKLFSIGHTWQMP